MKAPVLRIAALAAISGNLVAQAPPGYYASVDPTNASTLRATLHAVIDDHVKIPYTATATDTWDVLNLANEDPTNTSRILDVYKNQSYAKQPGGNSFYNREHTWPNSYGFPDDGPCNYPYTDCHMLFLCDIAYNATRGNAPYRACAGCSELTTVFNNGLGGGSGVYPGNSNWSNGSGSTSNFETWIGRRGDVARAILYADVRYEGGSHAGTGCAEPDLVVTDSQALISASATGNNELVAYMGVRSALVQWSRQDPPDAWERHKNDVVFAFQQNRNPFIDHPEWVDCLFAGTCASATVYCTAKVNSLACVPAIGASGVACVRGGSAFSIQAANVISQKSGLLFYGVNGQSNASFQGGFMCVRSPTRRTPIQSSGGTLTGDDCTGSFSFDFNAWSASGADPQLAAGATVNAQYWSRDPADPFTTSLTNAVQFYLGP